MNFRGMETDQKLRGGYYTQPDIAVFLSRWVLERMPERILEPSCGDGAFIQAVVDLMPSHPVEIVGCEIEPSEAGKCIGRVRMGTDISVLVHVADFLEWSLGRLGSPPEFDAVLGNPPFVRYQYLDAQQQARAERIFAGLDLPFTKHTNAWVPFIVASLDRLRPGGRMAMVVPAEIMHVLHAKSARDFILRQCSRVLVLDPDTLWFDDTLQGVVLLLAEKRSDDNGKLADVAVVRMNGRDPLKLKVSECCAESDYIPGSVMNGKWMLALLTARERSVLSTLASNPCIAPFHRIATVDVGIVTGANKFFLVPDRVVAEHGLERWAHPMFGRSEHVAGVVYGKVDHESNRKKGLPTNFIWFKEDLFQGLSDGARRYIRLGENQNIHRRYKCRIRTPWYVVPSVYATPVAMLKRSHHLPRLVLNRMNALTTDTAYRIKPKQGSRISLVTSFVNSLTALTAELEGRHYGGGVLELVPSEIERLLVPVRTLPSSAIGNLDASFRRGSAVEEILQSQDALVLHPLGISGEDCRVMRDAWSRLRSRRQRRTGSTKPTEEDE